jgi:hypothetical protein
MEKNKLKKDFIDHARKHNKQTRTGKSMQCCHREERTHGKTESSNFSKYLCCLVNTPPLHILIMLVNDEDQ